MRPVTGVLTGFAVLTACHTLGACNHAANPALVASDVVITEPMPGRPMSAGYLSLSNNTGETIKISSVTSPQFGSIEFHESSLVDGIARMRKIADLSISARSTIVLEPGGKHLMLMRPADDIDQVSVNFYGGDTLLLNLKVPLSKRHN